MKINIKSDQELYDILSEDAAEKISEISIMHNITHLPSLQHLKKLKLLWVRSNKLKHIADFLLPEELQSLDLDRNNIRNISKFPNSLIQINIDYNRLIILPRLPESLTDLSAFHNQLIFIPILPKCLNNCDVSHNRLKTIPDIPPTLIFFHAYSNRLTSIPKIHENIFYFTFLGITDLQSGAIRGYYYHRTHLYDECWTVLG